MSSLFHKDTLMPNFPTFSANSASSINSKYAIFWKILIPLIFLQCSIFLVLLFHWKLLLILKKLKKKFLIDTIEKKRLDVCYWKLKKYLRSFRSEVFVASCSNFCMYPLIRNTSHIKKKISITVREISIACCPWLQILCEHGSPIRTTMRSLIQNILNGDKLLQHCNSRTFTSLY